MLTHHDPLSLHIYTASGRFYSVNGLQYPGVGTILNATDSVEQQEFWSRWRSHRENVEYSDHAKHRGKAFHGLVENHFKSANFAVSCDADEVASPKGQADVGGIAQPLWESVQDVLPRITNPLLIESACWHEVGHYAGTVDMACSFDGVPCILDWKTATRPKKPEYLDRYPLQLAAYCGAINRMYGTRINRGVVVVALPECEAQVFRFALGDYWQPWLRRLISYWEQQSTPLAAQALKMIEAEYKIGIGKDSPVKPLGEA